MTSAAPARRHMALVSFVAGIVLIVSAVVLVHQNAPAPTDAGALPALSPVPPAVLAGAPRSAIAVVTSTTPTSASLDGAVQAGTALSAVPTVAAGTTTAGRHGPAASRVPTRPSGRPAVLHLPTLDVTATIDPVDSAGGVLQVPEDISRVGWWQHSADAGSTAGSTVIDGHIDSAVAGEGALFHLAELAPGDPVSVTTSTGTTVHYLVQARRVYVKEQGLPAELFSQQGPGRLVLISCGGTFDKSIRSYEDNIAVFATPVA